MLSISLTEAATIALNPSAFNLFDVIEARDTLKRLNVLIEFESSLTDHIEKRAQSLINDLTSVRPTAII